MNASKDDVEAEPFEAVDQPDTRTVTRETVTVPISTEGFAYVCTECETAYVARRPTRDGDHTFCSTNCRMTFHKRRKREREKETQQG